MAAAYVVCVTSWMVTTQEHKEASTGISGAAGVCGARQARMHASGHIPNF